jgi:hypothetical protein
MSGAIGHRLGQRIAAIARVATLLLALAGPAAWLALDALQARAHELAGDAGARMLAYGEQHQLEGVNTLMLNGLALRMQAGTTAEPPRRVLDELGARCRARAGQLREQLQQAAHGKLPPRIAARALDPSVQLADEHSGFLGCLDLGGDRVSPSELLARARRFSVEADVAELGALRFAWARKQARATRFVTVWSDGPLPLARAFPASGDAPGSDAPGMPRPAHSRRVLSAWAVGAAPLLVAYESDAPVTTAFREYAAVLRSAGQRVQLGTPEGDGTRWLTAQSGDTTHALIVSPHATGSLLAITALR